MIVQSGDDVPSYLRSVTAFRAFIDEEFAGLTTAEKGERFAAAALTFLRAQDWAKDFPDITLDPDRSYESGRDIISGPNPAGVVLRGEARYSLSRVDELDGLFRKWRELERRLAPPVDDRELAFHVVDSSSVTSPHFVLLARTRLGATIRRYELQGRSSKEFYDRLNREQRLHVYDIEEIYRWTRAGYLRQHGIPSDFRLSSDHPWLHVGNVYLGSIRGSELVNLVDEHGEALFFENIRGWLGDRSQVNATIIKSATEEPEKFLERNNGVTFRVEGVTPGDDEKVLIVKRGNIVNGCQTTMAVWHARPTGDALRVQIKIVESDDGVDAWRIAESANYQNQVTELDLKLAQYLRPQLLSRHASRLGQPLGDQQSDDIQAMLQAVTRGDATYQLAKYLFLGLFSQRPADLFSDDYGRVRQDVISAYYRLGDGQAEDRLFERLFLVMAHGRAAIDAAGQRLQGREHGERFRRVFQDEGVKYQAYVILLTLAAVLDMDFSPRRADAQEEAERIDRFLASASALARDEPERLARASVWALHSVVDAARRDDDVPRKIKQYVSRVLSSVRPGTSSHRVGEGRHRTWRQDRDPGAGGRGPVV